jgi:hypothetical protein
MDRWERGVVIVAAVLWLVAGAVACRMVAGY